MQRVEVIHHTREQVEGYLRDAGEIIDTLEIADDLRVAAFGKAVDLLASKTVQAVAVPQGIIEPVLR